jgi:hypothetical protein
MFKYMKQKCYDKKKLCPISFSLPYLNYYLSFDVCPCFSLSVFPFLEALLAILAASEYNKYPES